MNITEAVRKIKELQKIYGLPIDSEEHQRAYPIINDLERRWGDKRGLIKAWYDFYGALFPCEIEIGDSLGAFSAYKISNAEDLLNVCVSL